MLKKTIVFLLFALLIINSASAQEQLTLKLGENDIYTPENNANATGTVYIIQDSKLNDLVSKNVYLNEKLKYTPGYRLQVFFSSDRSARQESEKIKKKLKVTNPDLAVYIEYNAPFWKVKLGDFKTENEALRLRKKLMDDFPNSWVINEMVKKHNSLPNEEENEDESETNE